MKSLHDERAVLIQQRPSNAKHAFDGFFSKECEIANHNIYRDAEFSSRELLIRHHAKITAASLLSYLNQLWHHVDANDMDIRNSEFTSQPPFATPHVEHGTRRTAQYCIQDRLVGDLPAAFDLSITNGNDPQRRILVP